MTDWGYKGKIGPEHWGHPVKVDVRHTDQYNALDGSLITLPVLVIAGEFDPLAPAVNQAKLYTRLASGHKQWVTVPGGDHAAFLEKPRAYFIHELVAFLQGVTLDSRTGK